MTNLSDHKYRNRKVSRDNRRGQHAVPPYFNLTGRGPAGRGYRYHCYVPPEQQKAFSQTQRIALESLLRPCDSFF